MKIESSAAVERALATAPEAVQRAFGKQIAFLKNNLRHPSLRAKKYDEKLDIWQARVNDDWRFFFVIRGDTYRILALVPHPK